MAKKATKSKEYLELEAAYFAQQAAHERAIEFSEMLEKGWQECAIEKGKLQDEIRQGSGKSPDNIARDLAGALRRLDCQKLLVSTLKQDNVDLEERLRASTRENLGLKEEYAALQVKYSDAREIAQDYRDSWNSTREELKTVTECLVAKQTLLDKERDSSLKAIQLIDKDVGKKEYELNKLTEAYNKLLAAKGCTRDASTNTKLPPSKEEQATDVLGLSWGKDSGIQTQELDLPLVPVRQAAAILQQQVRAAGEAFGSLLLASKTKWADFEDDK
jgi:hypothetical protein